MNGSMHGSQIADNNVIKEEESEHMDEQSDGGGKDKDKL